MEMIDANQHRLKREYFSFSFSFKSKFSLSIESFSLPSLKTVKLCSNDLKLSAMLYQSVGRAFAIIFFNLKNTSIISLDIGAND